MVMDLSSSTVFLANVYRSPLVCNCVSFTAALSPLQ